MSETVVKAIILDLWGTIAENGVYPSPSKQAQYFLRVRIPFSEFITTFEEGFMTKEHETLKEGFEQVVNDFNIRIPEFVYEKLVGMWNKNAILSKLYPETEEVIKGLKEEGYKVFLLANIDKSSYEQVKQKFGLEELFDAVYPSYRTGLLKINNKSIKKILSENKLKEEDVVLVGDSVDSDMKSAEQAGIKGILVDRRDKREFTPKITSLKELSGMIKGL